MMGRYRVQRRTSGPVRGAHLKQMGLVTLLLLSGSYLGRDQVVSRAVLAVLLVFYTGLTAWASGVVGRLHRRLERGYLALERTLLAGPRDALAGWLADSGDPRRMGVDVVGYVTDATAPPSGHPALGGGEVPWLGSTDDLADLAERHRVSQVAFWDLPGTGAGAQRTLVRLRLERIRMRWILAEAWLLAAGARAEDFGSAASGVLDPDDSHVLRRGIVRPLEILAALPLLVTGGLLAIGRRRRQRRGEVRLETVDLLHGDGHQDRLRIAVAADGRALPLWWQRDLARALLAGRIGLVGAPLRASNGAADIAGLLRDTASARPGLTGEWAVAGESAGRPRCRRLRSMFMNPGGWTADADPAGETMPRESGEEVQ